MPERLYQLGFGEEFNLVVSQDVTPEGFAGLEFDTGDELDLPVGEVGRFVREVVERVQIKTAGDVGQYLLDRVYTPFEDFDQEELWVLLLDAKHRVTHEVMAYRGTVGGLNVRGAELFKEAIRVNAPVLILSHCHPSGDPTPSPEDVLITMEANKGAALLDIILLDHVVVGKDSWVSMKERGLGFE